MLTARSGRCSRTQKSIVDSTRDDCRTDASCWRQRHSLHYLARMRAGNESNHDRGFSSSSDRAMPSHPPLADGNPAGGSKESWKREEICLRETLSGKLLRRLLVRRCVRSASDSKQFNGRFCQVARRHSSFYALNLLKFTLAQHISVRSMPSLQRAIIPYIAARNTAGVLYLPPQQVGQLPCSLKWENPNGEPPRHQSQPRNAANDDANAGLPRSKGRFGAFQILLYHT